MFSTASILEITFAWKDEKSGEQEGHAKVRKRLWEKKSMTSVCGLFGGSIY